MSAPLPLLILCCLSAFCSPRRGIVLLLALTSTLFSLHQYATVPLPLGYVEPPEAILAVLQHLEARLQTVLLPAAFERLGRLLGQHPCVALWVMAFSFVASHRFVVFSGECYPQTDLRSTLFRGTTVI